MSAFNILFFDFLPYQVNNIKVPFTAFKYFANSSQIPNAVSSIHPLNIVQDPEV